MRHGRRRSRLSFLAAALAVAACDYGRDTPPRGPGEPRAEDDGEIWRQQGADPIYRVRILEAGRVALEPVLAMTGEGPEPSRARFRRYVITREEFERASGGPPTHGGLVEIDLGADGQPEVIRSRD